MRSLAAIAIAATLITLASTAGKPLLNVSKYDGKFTWLKTGALAPAAAKSMASAKTILIDLTFPSDVRLLKDKNGHQWFTFLGADQGPDWKWNQTKASAGLPAAGGVIKAGTTDGVGIPRRNSGLGAEDGAASDLYRRGHVGPRQTNSLDD